MVAKHSVEKSDDISICGEFEEKISIDIALRSDETTLWIEDIVIGEGEVVGDVLGISLSRDVGIDWWKVKVLEADCASGKNNNYEQCFFEGHYQKIIAQSGEGGIRTHEGFILIGFQDRRTRPLCDLSCLRRQVTVLGDLSIKIFYEARRGIEPLHSGFADRRVTSSPPSQRAYRIRDPAQLRLNLSI